MFSNLAQYGLKLKLSKCRVMRQKIQYLGQVVEAGGVSMDPAKVQDVQDWYPPKIVNELCFFLKLAQIAAPLTQLLSGHTTQKKKSLPPSIQARWRNTQQLAFQMLKQKLTLVPLLAYTDYTKLFWVYTDLSLQSLGAVLAQVQGGCEWVIAYASHSSKLCITYYLPLTSV